jgi:hypothetical protein
MKVCNNLCGDAPALQLHAVVVSAGIIGIDCLGRQRGKLLAEVHLEDPCTCRVANSLRWKKLYFGEHVLNKMTGLYMQRGWQACVAAWSAML